MLGFLQDLGRYLHNGERTIKLKPRRMQGRRNVVMRWLWRNLNFYRSVYCNIQSPSDSCTSSVHLLAFCVIPLISSVIFYLVNGQYKISFVDALFQCFTSMTVNGLATVNLSTLTGKSFEFSSKYVSPLTFYVRVSNKR
jgi:hypothetical protein